MKNSLKTKVKYWFEYLRLAHLSQDSEIVQNLQKNPYKDWGNYLDISFEDWWKKHSKLFRNHSVIKRLTLDDEIESDVFTIQFPFTYAPTTASKIFKEMYEREFEQRRSEKRKLKKVYGGSYSLTVDDLKVDRFRYYLHYTKNVYLPLKNSGNKLSTKHFIKKAEEAFKAVKKLKSSSKESTVPFQTSSDVYENQSRNARRYNIYTDNLLFNVSTGIFPGEYEKPRAQKVFAKKRTQYKKRAFSKGVPRSKYENYKSRESGFDMYEKRGKRRKINV